MKSISLLFAVLFSFLFAQVGFTQANEEVVVSGKIVDGLRLLSFAPDQHNDFVIYRGDYIQPALGGYTSFTLTIPELGIEKTFPVPKGERAYVKMKKPGSYNFTAGTASGIIKVIEYNAASYRELSAEQAVAVLKNTNPVILDVRTQGEFQQGYIQGANLLPVQVLQDYLDKLAEYKNHDILVYCATGNRSTVASRILIENGFKKIYNLRYGIVDWAKRGHQVVR